MRLLLYLLFPLVTFSQRNYTGLIVDKITASKIPYATVGLIKENKGTSADENGIFKINSSFPHADSLRISSVGYEPLVLPLSNWVNGNVVELQRKLSLLQEVIISANQQEKIYTINGFRNCSSNFFEIGWQTMSQLAQRFEAPKQGMQLTELELCKDKSESIFRFRIYDIDSTCECPSKDLADTVIEVRSKEKHVRINLENYNIVIPGTSYFVAIEWLFTPSNESFQKQKRDGRKLYITYYKPFIRWVRNRNAKPKNLWQLEFNGKWSEMTYFTDDNFQITSKLK